MNSRVNFYTQSGFGLSEVLIGLFLASMILTLLSQVYLSNKTRYSLTQKVLESHLDLQWVSDLLADNLRSGGFTPCLNLDQLKIIDTRTGSIPKAITIDNDKQSLQINRMSPRFSKVIDMIDPTHLMLAEKPVQDLKAPLLIADCQHAEVHQIRKINPVAQGYQVILTKPLLYSYPMPTYAGAWLEQKWSIQTNLEAKQALYYQTEELTPHIQSLQVKQKTEKLFEIQLRLDNDTKQRLVVAVRSM